MAARALGGMLTSVRGPAAQPVTSSPLCSAQMISCHSLPFLLLLPLGACFPVLDRDVPVNALDVVGGGRSWANLAGGRHFLWGSPGWQRAPHPGAWLIMAKELQAVGRARASFGLRFGRQDNGSEAAGFLPGDGEKASGLLGTLAEELHGYSRKKGGFTPGQSGS